MQYTVIGGWSTDPEHLQVGLTRLLYPFFAGLLLSRMGWTLRVKGAFWWCSLAIATIMLVPRLGGDAGNDMWINGVYNLVIILFVLPLIVSIGAGSSVTDGRSSAINKFLGDISYPLYITHYPLVHMQVQWIATHPEASPSTHLYIAVCTFILSLMVAYATYRLYDLPIRQWLQKKCFGSKS